jgi:mRNA-degrading endonuclease toxin of MazEF toxin-antitoxin module
MNVIRGDVVIVDYFHASGQGSSLRPALVVQSDHNNSRIHNTIVAQITSNLHHLKEPTRLLIDPNTVDGKSSGLHMISVVTCENIVTIHKDLIHHVIGQLSSALMTRIDSCLKIALSLP